MELLEFILYQTKITYEHEMFIISFLTNKEQYLKNLLLRDINKYQNLLKELLIFANNKVSEKFLSSNQLITPYTKKLELETKKYFDIGIDTTITKECLKLAPGNELIDDWELKKYTNKLLSLIDNSLSILKDINKKEESKELFLTIYTLAIPHIIEETIILKTTLERILKEETVDPTYLYTLEYYYVKFLSEHALLIKNLLDPTKENISNQFLIEYNKLLIKFNNDVSPYTINDIHSTCKDITKAFIDFIDKITKAIINESKDIMVLPLIMDHFLRENNSFIARLDYCNK